MQGADLRPRTCRCDPHGAVPLYDREDGQEVSRSEGTAQSVGSTAHVAYAYADLSSGSIIEDQLSVVSRILIQQSQFIGIRVREVVWIS